MDAMSTRTVLGTCHHDCPDSCGWVVTVTDGVATKLRGNPAHPYSQGELCPKVNRFLDRVYSPDRILQPLVRTGPKGSGEFEPVSWDHALELVATKLHGVVAEHGGEAILPWGSAGTQGLIQMSSLDARLFARLGASRTSGALCGAVAGSGTASTLGSGRSADPMDIRHAELILLWGTNTRLTNRHLWPFVEEARAAGATVVVIDPVRTITAESADWFVQPLPGTDTALALAMVHVLVRDDLLDHDYIDRHTTGFDKLAEQAAAWDPEHATPVCGVPAAEIERLAQAYGRTSRTFIRTLIGAEHHEHGAMIFRTLSCLPALTGAWRYQGGGFCRSVGVWADGHADNSAFAVPSTTRALPFAQLGEVLLDETLDPPVQALVIWNGNPVVSVPDAEAVKRGLSRPDLFTVVSEQFLTDTARYADVIFPATTQIEMLDVVPAWGHLYVGWNEPAIAPLGESVPNTELWRRLARALGFTEPELFEDDESLARSTLHGIDEATLRADGFVRLDLPAPLLPYAEGGFATATGTCNLWSDHLEATGQGGAPNFTPAADGPGSALAERFPLVLLTPKVHTRFLNSSYSHLPKHGPAEGAPYVELDPADAALRGVGEGDVVSVFNERARLRLPVRISTRLRPGVAAIPWGWWAGQHDDGLGANSLTSGAPTDWGGGVAYSDTLVDVSRD